MSEGKPERSKGTDAPKCKVCGKRHWGTCLNPTGGGYLSMMNTPAGKASSNAQVKVLKAAVAKAAAVKPRAKKARKR